MSEIHKCKCQICDEIYAEINIEEIKYPLNGSMFKSIDPEHGVPPPFYAGAEFEFMRCPFGQHRPMILPNTILLDNGQILNVPDGEPPFYTPLGEERQYTLDRDQVLPMPMMDEETAGRIARGLPINVIVSDAVPDNTILILPKESKDAFKIKNIGETDGKTRKEIIGPNNETLFVGRKDILKGEIDNGKTDTQQGQKDSIQPIEGKEKTEETNSERKVNYCAECDKQFVNKAGFRNHMRIKHKITNPEDYNNARSI
jgi:hypothetical protein